MPASYWDALDVIGAGSFNKGMLRLLGTDTSPSLEEFNAPSGWRRSWTNWRPGLVAFGSNWLGDPIAFDYDRIDPSSQEPMITVLESASGQMLYVPADLAGFLNVHLIENPDGLLGADMHAAWLAAGNGIPGLRQCAGLKVPLFLGGAYELNNLELADQEVYLDITGQLWSQALALPPGTQVTDVDIR